MSHDFSADQIEIINEFLQESRDMLENLEPTIIQLGQSCQNVDCWSTLGCTDTACPHHGRDLDIPCWLHAGYIGEGGQSCPYASSEQECRSCKVFTLINGDSATMNAIFRLFHSMKGSAGFLEMENIAHVSHAAESLLDLIRSGKISMEPTHVDLLCQACDFSRAAMEYVEKHFDDKGMSEQAEEVSARLTEAVAAAQERVARGLARAAPPPEPPPAAAPSFELLITPEMTEKFVQEADELLQNAEQALLRWAEAEETEALPSLFRDIHSFKGNCGFLGYADMEKLSHGVETILDAAKSGETFDIPKTSEMLLQMLDLLRDGIAGVSRGEEGRIEDLDRHLETLKSVPVSGEASAAAPQAAAPPPPPEPPLVPEQKASVPPPPPPPGEPPQAASPISPPKGSAPPSPRPQKPKEPSLPASAAVKRQDIRVDLEKLDHLINLIGEMVIAENMLIHNPDLTGLELESFNRSAQQMSKIVRELQELAMMIRMVPVSGLFRRMIRLVHDLSVKFGKKVDLQLSGEETELDKTVIETITDPLVHLIRNALDHGLDSPEERLKAGKAEKGVIRLSARHEEGEVWITLEDDGRGLNRRKILAKAASKGLIEGDGSDLSDKAVANLIFMPGFSTADKITDVSGRGVGMDVVKQNLEKIKGKIEVHSKEGRGTRFDLRIPLTLGIIDGMMVRVGDARCIVPTLAIREAFRPTSDAITVTPDGEELVRVRENFFPVIRLHTILGKEPEARELPDGILIVMEYQENRCCLFVDEILGQQQTVIKGLSDYIGNVRWVSGCTILGNGEVCLILDVGSLMETVEPQEATA